jgi:hypothetical protein
MRNPLHRSSLAIAVILAIMVLGTNLSAQPAGAATVRRRVYPSSRRIQRPYPWRASRSAFRSPVVVDGDVWARLRQCESGSRYDANTGNGFYGAYQFHPRTWRSLGYAGLPHQAPPELQDEAAQRLQARGGWGQWPVCSRRIGV